MKLLVLVGSLRADSFNRRLADLALTQLPAGVEAEIVTGLADLPFYSEDLDGADVPQAVTDLRAAVAGAGAILVVTPEYNGAISAVLKNALDWASRPRGEAAIAGKPAAVLGASGSPRGAQWARENAQRVLKVAGADVLDESVGIGSAWNAFSDNGFNDAEVAQAVHGLVADLVQRPLVTA